MCVVYVVGDDVGDFEYFYVGFVDFVVVCGVVFGGGDCESCFRGVYVECCVYGWWYGCVYL